MYTLEPSAYALFQRLWHEGEFRGQRYGQAFTNHFALHKMSATRSDDSRQPFDELYEADENRAKVLINALFVFDQ